MPATKSKRDEVLTRVRKWNPKHTIEQNAKRLKITKNCASGTARGYGLKYKAVKRGRKLGSKNYKETKTCR